MARSWVLLFFVICFEKLLKSIFALRKMKRVKIIDGFVVAGKFTNINRTRRRVGDMNG
jgi:hypothetical protein